MNNELQINNENDLKKLLASEYKAQINNYFGDEKKALRFLSSVVAAVQRNQTLLECTPVSLVNSFITMAQLNLMPSDVSGEAYVLPYNNSKKIVEDGKEKWVKVKEAQFQLGYQGLVTLFYRSGVASLVAEIVYKADEFEMINGQITHRVDPFNDRGEPVGAYVIATLTNGEKMTKAMSKKEILDIATKFSRSAGSKNSPWDPKNDPQLWMWRKTVLKQLAKILPKNEAILNAIAKDNEDSNIAERKAKAETITNKLTMGAIQKQYGEDKNETAEGDIIEEGDESTGSAS